MKLALFVLLGVAAAAAADKHDPEQARAFKQFTDRVNSYVTLHRNAEGSLPGLKTTDKPELIAAHQQALARKIKEVRVQARPGDIFTEDVREAIRHALRKAADGARGANARATIRQGPLLHVTLRVNDVYPDGLAFTTVPPTILAVLPKLPDEVVYRIVGRNLLLLDVRANLIVDLMPKAMPEHFVPEQ